MITNEMLVKNTLNIKPNTLEDYTINIMDMLGVDIDYSSMFKEKNKILDKSTGKVVCERKIVSADTFIKLKSKYSDGYRMSYEIYIFDEIILGVIYSNKGGVVFKSYKNSKTLASFYDKENFDIVLTENDNFNTVRNILKNKEENNGNKAEGVEALRKEEAPNIEELDLANIIDLIRPNTKSKVLQIKNRLSRK